MISVAIAIEWQCKTDIMQCAVYFRNVFYVHKMLTLLDQMSHS